MAAASMLLLTACGSGPSAEAPETTGVRAATTSTPSGASSTGGTPAGAIEVRVVADSEVPDPIADLLDQEPDIVVSSAVSIQGATMAELDASVDDALAEAPDVLVYSGGANDLPSGPTALLAGLQDRLARYQERGCVVMAVPIFRYERGTEAEVAQRTAGTRVLEQAAAATGASVASYLDVSLAMDRKGEDFFAEGELGDLHPDPRSYPAIADAIAEQVRACA